MKWISLLLVIIISNNTVAQAQVHFGGKGLNNTGLPSDAISFTQQNILLQEVKKSVQELEGKGILQKTLGITNHVLFDWPLKQVVGYNDPSYWGISNYIDEDTTSGILDYNCGNRTYDGHLGTDISLFPFPWHKMAVQQVEIIAAAPGTIIYKADNNYDSSCAFCTNCNWNAVYIQNTDGSVSFYGHMKSGTLTTKAVGSTVAVGEYLGYVGSAGNSTGPHLHFEVWQDNSFTKLIDPWAGNCNYLNTTDSWWQTQIPYFNPYINLLTTSAAATMPFGCFNEEVYNPQDIFLLGSTVYFTGYFRDAQVGDLAVYSVYKPDGELWFTNNITYTTSYTESYYYYYYTLPTDNSALGAWKFQVTYKGQTVTHYFYVATSMPELNKTFTFTGNGNWNNAANWSNSTIPPTYLPATDSIIINPTVGGSCIMNAPQYILTGGYITVLAGKGLVTPGFLIIQ